MWIDLLRTIFAIALGTISIIIFSEFIEVFKRGRLK